MRSVASCFGFANLQEPANLAEFRPMPARDRFLQLFVHLLLADGLKHTAANLRVL